MARSSRKDITITKHKHKGSEYCTAVNMIITQFYRHSLPMGEVEAMGVHWHSDVDVVQGITFCELLELPIRFQRLS